MNRFIFLLTVICVSGCVSVPPEAKVVKKTAQLRSIQMEKAAILEKIKIGMPLPEFHQLVPDAYVASMSNETTAYELAYEQKFVTEGDIARHGIPFSKELKARTYKQVLWFYFYQDRLVQWGQPNVWPTKPNAPITISPKVIQCENCGHEIGKLEKTYIHEGHVVCSQCYSKLKQQP